MRKGEGEEMLPLRGSPSSLSPKLTDIDNVEGQPVQEGVAHQLGKEQAQGELHHALAGEEGTSETSFSQPPPFSALGMGPRCPGFAVPSIPALTGIRSAPRKLMASGSSAGSLGLLEWSPLLWPERLRGPSLEVTASGSFSLVVTPPGSSSEPI